MNWLWTWGGRSFGYRQGDELFTHGGRHVGHFVGDEVYGLDGAYLGELYQDRLIRARAKQGNRSGACGRYGNQAAVVNYADYVGYVMIAGYEDFPELE